MRIVDVRGQPTDKIYRLQMRYPARFYRAIGTEHVHGETTDADIREFQERARKEGAVAIFISNYGQTAYIPLEMGESHEERMVRQKKQLERGEELLRRGRELTSVPYPKEGVMEKLPQTRYKLLPEDAKRKLPPLGATGDEKDPMVWVKFFTPWTFWTWYVIEFDGQDTFFGWVVGLEKEFGSFSLSELESIRGPAGLRIERDRWFAPKPISQVMTEHGESLAMPQTQPIILKGKEYWSKVNATQKAMMQSMGANRVLEVHSDGDLTFEAEGERYVLTTGGELFAGKPTYRPDRPGPLPQTMPGDDPDLLKYYNVPPEAY